MRRIAPIAASLTLMLATPAHAESLWPTLRPIYEDLHAHPELSFQETATAAKMAEHLKRLGFTVTTGVGKTGVVGIMKNGAGPTVMLRTEMDGLPVEEKTGLPYASKATGTNPAGLAVPTMHACGHDVHMTAWLGAATTLAGDKKSWHGTLMMVAQPAEEIGGGAQAMLDDGLFTRFPKPDFALAVHDNDSLAAGTIGIKAGPMLASADSVDIVVYGKGGHGARPHKTIDPIVIAAKIVLGLQTVVSRENDPFDPAVITVGSIHGGTKHNIIPDEVRMQLTVRAYKQEVRARLLAGIERIAKAECEAGNAPKPPDRDAQRPFPSHHQRPRAGRARPRRAEEGPGRSARQRSHPDHGRGRFLDLRRGRRPHPDDVDRRREPGRARARHARRHRAARPALLPLRPRPAADDHGRRRCAGDGRERSHGRREAAEPCRRSAACSRPLCTATISANTAKFYREVLNLGVHFSDDRLVALDASGATVLLLFKRGASSEGVSFPEGFIPPHDGSGPAHIAFAVDAESLDAWETRLADGRRRDREQGPMGARRPQHLLSRSRGALGRAGDAGGVADVLGSGRRFRGAPPASSAVSGLHRRGFRCITKAAKLTDPSEPQEGGGEAGDDPDSFLQIHRPVHFL